MLLVMYALGKEMSTAQSQLFIKVAAWRKRVVSLQPIPYGQDLLSINHI